MRILSSILLAAAVFGGSPAQALDYNFVFSGREDIKGGTGSVSGRILGLEDNTAGQMADAVIIDEAIFGDGSKLDLSLLSAGRNANLWDSNGVNNFSVSNGVIDPFFYISDQFITNTFEFQDIIQVASSDGVAFFVVNFENGSDFQLRVSTQNGDSITFSQISAVPLPGAFGLLLTAIAGLGFYSRRGRARA